MSFLILRSSFWIWYKWNSKLEALWWAIFSKVPSVERFLPSPLIFWEAMELPLSFVAFCYLFQKCSLVSQSLLNSCSFIFYSFIEVLLIANEVTSLHCTAWRMSIFPLLSLPPTSSWKPQTSSSYLFCNITTLLTSTTIN